MTTTTPLATTATGLSPSDVCAPSAPLSLGLRRTLAVAVAILSFAATFYLYTRHTHFPLRYHPDEPGKVEQVLGDYRNYNHPTMMLDFTKVAANVLHVEEEPQAIASVGRSVSAFFAAGCVAFLAIAGYLEAGLAGMLFVAFFVGASPFLFTYAHYMKEDAGLMFGVGLFLLAARMVWIPWRHRWKEIATVLLLGAACAVAASGKYIGAVTVVVGWLILFCGHRWWWTDLALRPIAFATAALLCVWGLNYRVIHDWADARDNVARSVRQPIENNFNSVVSLPNTYYLHVIREVTPPHVLVLAVLAIPVLLLTWRRRNGWDVLVVLTLLITVALLCFGCTLAFPRYALPAVVDLHFLAALALAWSYQWARQRLPASLLPKAVSAVAVLAALGAAVYLADAYRQFSSDSRDRLREWLNANGKPGQLVAADAYAGFRSFLGGDDSQPTTVRVDSQMWAADIGDADSLKSNGYTYVAISDLAYARYTDGLHVAQRNEEDDFARRREWYNRLLKDGQLVWANIPAHNLYGYTNPELRLYRVDGTSVK